MSNKRQKIEPKTTNAFFTWDNNNTQISPYESSIIKQAELENCYYSHYFTYNDTLSFLNNKEVGTYFIRKSTTYWGFDIISICWRSYGNSFNIITLQQQVMFEPDCLQIKIDEYSHTNLPGFILHGKKNSGWTKPYTGKIPCSWTITRLLWIGNKKEDSSYCMLAILPNDITKEISKHMYYLPFIQEQGLDGLDMSNPETSCET